MNKILFSSVSKKFVMALAGVFLLIFLPVHLIINLMLLKDDPEPFNSAARFHGFLSCYKDHRGHSFYSAAGPSVLWHLPSDPKLACPSGRLCRREQIRNIILFTVYDMDWFINSHLPGPSFFQFLFYQTWTGPG